MDPFVTKPIVLIAEELSPATVEALGPDFDVRSVDGTDRPALLAALATAQAVLIRSATKMDAEAIASSTTLKVIATMDNHDGRLNTGMTGVAKIEGQTMPVWKAFSQAIIRFVKVQVWSWIP